MKRITVRQELPARTSFDDHPKSRYPSCVMRLEILFAPDFLMLLL